MNPTARLRGKDVMSRAQIRVALREANELADGPWEPAIFVKRDALERARMWPASSAGQERLKESASVQHDPAATHDIHLPGDGERFDVDAAVAKLMIAEVLIDY
jgi:hypothetical protein